MFSLIITIISIALVAALALATIYYGGTAFTQGGDAARAAQHINEGQQLQGARTLAAVALEVPTTIAGLATEYLAQVPTGWTTNGTVVGEFTGATAFTLPGVTAAVCAAVNERADIAAPADVAAAVAAPAVFSCTAGNVVVYKF